MLESFLESGYMQLLELQDLSMLLTRFVIVTMEQ
jgi:hypothetical protein